MQKVYVMAFELHAHPHLQIKVEQAKAMHFRESKGVASQHPTEFLESRAATFLLSPLWIVRKVKVFLQPVCEVDAGQCKAEVVLRLGHTIHCKALHLHKT